MSTLRMVCHRPIFTKHRALLEGLSLGGLACPLSHASSVDRVQEASLVKD